MLYNLERTNIYTSEGFCDRENLEAAGDFVRNNYEGTVIGKKLVEQNILVFICSGEVIRFTWKSAGRYETDSLFFIMPKELGHKFYEEKIMEFVNAYKIVARLNTIK